MKDNSKIVGSWRTPALIIGFGCLIALMAFGPRSSLGFFLTPLSSANHWGRDVFAFALALQNLLWGIGQPLAGMIADRFGTVRVVCAGALMYAAGLALMAHADSAPILDAVGRRAGRLRPFRLFVHGAARGVRQDVAASDGARAPSASARRRVRSGSFSIRRSLSR